MLAIDCEQKTFSGCVGTTISIVSDHRVPNIAFVTSPMSKRSRKETGVENASEMSTFVRVDSLPNELREQVHKAIQRKCLK